MWCDNEACCLVTRDASSIKRLAYIARRVRLIQELEARRIISIQNIEGIKNPADVLTKYLGKPDYVRYTSSTLQQRRWLSPRLPTRTNTFCC